jgi:Family of unknown function (DUF5317)
VFLLYAVLIGLAAGLLLGGRPGRLAEIPLRWTWLIVAGMVIQGLLYSDPVSQRVAQVGPAVGPAIYVASMAMVLAAVIRNARIPGLVLVAIGGALNLAAIVANGGFMPASLAALGSHVPPPGSGYSNSVVLANPALAPLTDIFALPDWLPAGNVFSIGDIFIAVGIAAAIVIQMRRRPGVPEPEVSEPPSPMPEVPSPAMPGRARCGPTTPPSGTRH